MARGSKKLAESTKFQCQLVRYQREVTRRIGDNSEVLEMDITNCRFAPKEKVYSRVTEEMSR